MHSDCDYCNSEKDCHYPYKPCDCVRKRKFWTAEQRQKHDGVEVRKQLEGRK